jgi:tetratricopeptide (TPR) repeat protein
LFQAEHDLTDSAVRLGSWKAIASYLGRSPRTVQRWLADYGLPIHRMGGASGPIFAYKDELDIWLRNRRHADVSGADVPRQNAPSLRPVPVSAPAEESALFSFPVVPGLRRGRSADLTTLALSMWETSSSVDFTAAVRLFREAIDLDPSNVRAMAGLSFVLLVGGLLGSVKTPVYASTAEDALRRAVEIDPEATQVRVARAWIRMAVTHDWKSARRNFTEALARNPLHGPALVGRAVLHIAESSLAEASDLLLEASTQSPLSAPTTFFRCWNAYLSGNSSSALALLAQARMIGHSGAALDALEALALVEKDDPEASLERLQPLSDHAETHPIVNGLLGYCLATSGQTREAQSILRGLMHARAHGREDVSYPLALIFLGLHDRPNAIRWLKLSYADGSLWSLAFQSDPLLASIRLDPLYQSYLNNLNYPAPEDSAARLASAS